MTTATLEAPTTTMSKSDAIRQVINTLSMMSSTPPTDADVIFSSVQGTFPSLIDYSNSREIYNLMSAIYSVLRGKDSSSPSSPSNTPRRPRTSSPSPSSHQPSASPTEILHTLIAALESHPSPDSLLDSIVESQRILALCGNNLDEVKNYLDILIRLKVAGSPGK